GVMARSPPARLSRADGLYPRGRGDSTGELEQARNGVSPMVLVAGPAGGRMPSSTPGCAAKEAGGYRMARDEAFLQAIVENPDDDTPRVVYADWLDEHGDAARAEFIRLQVRLSGGDARGTARLRRRGRGRLLAAGGEG